MDEVRKLVYEERDSIEEFGINDDGTLNNLVYRKWLLTRKEFRTAKTDSEMEKMMLTVFNDAHFICTFSLMHKKSDKYSRRYIKQSETPSLVMPLVYLYLSHFASVRRDIDDLLKLIEGDCECFPDWKENLQTLKKAVKGFNYSLPASTFSRRIYTPKLLASIRWSQITNGFKVHSVRKSIGFIVNNLNEQKMVARAILRQLKSFEIENEPGLYIDEEDGSLNYLFDFTETHQLIKELLESEEFQPFNDRKANLDDIKPVKTNERNVHRGRPKRNLDDIYAAFQLVKKFEGQNYRLDVFCDCLKHDFVANDTDKKVLIDMFNGIHPEQKIVWKGHLYELHYLFKKLHPAFIKICPKCGVWQAVCSCFVIRKNISAGAEPSNIYRQEDCELDPVQFVHGKCLDSHDQLDNIIKLLDYKHDYTHVLNILNGSEEE